MRDGTALSGLWGEGEAGSEGDVIPIKASSVVCNGMGIVPFSNSTLLSTVFPSSSSTESCIRTAGLAR